MQYTVVISEKPDGQWQAFVPVLPNCTVEAPTREQVLARIKDDLTAVAPKIEVLQVEVLVNGAQNGQHKKSFEEEWPGFGAFKNDPFLSQLFDDIERERDATLVGE